MINFLIDEIQFTLLFCASFLLCIFNQPKGRNNSIFVNYRSEWHRRQRTSLRRKKKKREERPVLTPLASIQWNMLSTVIVLWEWNGEPAVGRCTSIPEREAVVKLPTRRNMSPIHGIDKKQFRLRPRSCPANCRRRKLLLDELSRSHPL